MYQELKNICGGCGAELPEGAKYCTRCGKPLHEVPLLRDRDGQPIRDFSPEGVKYFNDLVISAMRNGMIYTNIYAGLNWYADSGTDRRNAETVRAMEQAESWDGELREAQSDAGEQDEPSLWAFLALVGIASGLGCFAYRLLSKWLGVLTGR